ncbi:MAG: YceK/YidQ family lipoprotein [Planctomycetota bacterium]|jgi:uncharacterized protein YceK
MVRRFSLLAVLTLVLCSLPGCFTITTQDTGKPPGPRVFSGTRAHGLAMASGRVFWHHGEYWTPRTSLVPIPIWLPLDLPLSFAADILILPYTIPTQLMYGNFKEEEEEEAPSTRRTDK